MADGNGLAVRFLGTNGWYATRTGNTACTLIDAPQAYIVLDAGDGIQHLDKFVKGKKPVHLYLSHFHLDHTAGLHLLAKFRFKGGIRIFGQNGTKRALGLLASHPYTVALKELKTKVGVAELSAGEHIVSSPFGSYSAGCLPLVHADPCFGYRFRLGEKIISYCTDTGPCGNYLKLAAGADLLITECSMPSGFKVDERWPHLSPEIAARLAKKAACKKLALTHFGANFYIGMKMRGMAEKVARKTFKNTIAAKDGMEIKV